MTAAQSSDPPKPDDYEEQQIAAIEKWKSDPPSVVSQVLGVLAAPVAWLINQVVPAKAIQGAIAGASWLAQQTIDVDDILRDGGVASISDLRRDSLERCDDLADAVHNWAIGIATAEGAAAGSLGLPGMAADVPMIITLAMRTIRKIGLCYGYECQGDGEQEFVFGILSSAGANTVTEKLEALAALRTIEVMLVRQTWKAMGTRAAAKAFSKEGGILAIRNLAKQLGVNLTKRKALQVIPAVGALVGGSMNGVFINDVGWAARRCFQERWLIENGKLLDD